MSNKNIKLPTDITKLCDRYDSVREADTDHFTGSYLPQKNTSLANASMFLVVCVANLLLSLLVLWWIYERDVYGYTSSYTTKIEPLQILPMEEIPGGYRLLWSADGQQKIFEVPAP